MITVKIPLAVSIPFTAATILVGAFAGDAMPEDLRVWLFWLGVVAGAYSVFYGAYLVAEAPALRFFARIKTRKTPNKPPSLAMLPNEKGAGKDAKAPDGGEYDLIPTGSSIYAECHSDGTDVYISLGLRNRSPRNIKIKLVKWDFEIGGKKQSAGNASTGYSGKMQPSTTQIIHSGKVRFYKPKGEIKAWVEASIGFGGALEEALEYVMHVRYELTIPSIPETKSRRRFKVEGVERVQTLLRYDRPPA